MIRAALFGAVENGISNIAPRYFEHISRCGVKAEAIYPMPPHVAAQVYDCLTVCGGGDTDPTLYGQSPWKADTVYKTELDRYELILIKEFIKLEKPILGICKGMQSINIATGGNLIQDIPSMLSLCHSADCTRECNHEIKISPQSRLFAAMGRRAIVNSFHHQCIGRLGKGLSVTATAHDGVTEAIEGTQLPLLGVQWHPERMSGNAIFELFFKVFFK